RGPLGIANLARLRDSHCRTSAEAALTGISEHWRAEMARKNPTLPAKPSARSASDARADLVARAAHNAEGATMCRSHPLADARALTRILAALEAHREVRDDIGVLPEDVQTMQDLVRDLAEIAGAPATVSDEHAQLLEAQGALRAFFDLFAAKASLALAADPDERARVLALLPRVEER